MRTPFSDNIKALRYRLRLTQFEFAEQLEITEQTVWNWEQGSIAKPRSKDVIDTIMRLYNVTETDLFGISDGLYARQSNQQIPAAASDTYAPVLGNIAAGDPRCAMEQEGEMHWVRPDLLERYPDGYFLVVAGDSMDRVLPDGCYAFIAPVEVRDGDIAAIKVNGDDATIKRVKLAPAINAVKLFPESTNPEHQPRLIDKDDPDAPEVRLLGRVVWFDAEI